MKRVLLWAVCVYMLFVGSEEYFKGPGPTYKIAVGLCAFMLAAVVLDEVRFRFTLPVVVMAAFTACAVASLLWTVAPQRTLDYTIILGELQITSWITVSCLSRESDRTQLVLFLALASLFPAVGMIHDVITGHISWTMGYIGASTTDFGARMTFGDADPNLLAFRFAVSAICATHLALQPGRAWRKAAFLGLACACIAAQMRTGSRGGLMALVLGLLTLILFEFRKKLGMALVLVAAFTALMLAIRPYLPVEVMARYQGVGEEIAYGSMAGRKDIYHEGLQSFQRDPMLGVGYSAFETASLRHNGIGDAAHNDPLQVLVDLGLLGFCVYLALLGVLLGRAAKAEQQWKGLALGLFAAYLVSGFSITLLNAKIAWLVFGVLLALGGRAGPAPKVIQEPVASLERGSVSHA